MGTYNGYPLNWLIVGYSRSPNESNTPAGSAIWAEVGKNTYISKTSNYINYLSGLNAGEFLVISECALKSSNSYTVSGSITYSCKDQLAIDFSIAPIDYIRSYEKYCRSTTITNSLQSDMNTLFNACSFGNYASYITTNSTIGNGTNKFFAPTSTQFGYLKNKIAYVINTSNACNWWYAGATSTGPTWATTQYNYHTNVILSSGSTGNIHVGKSIVSSYTQSGGGSGSVQFVFLSSITVTHSSVNGAYLRPCMVVKLYDLIQ